MGDKLPLRDTEAVSLLDVEMLLVTDIVTLIDGVRDGVTEILLVTEIDRLIVAVPDLVLETDELIERDGVSDDVTDTVGEGVLDGLSSTTDK